MREDGEIVIVAEYFGAWIANHLRIDLESKMLGEAVIQYTVLYHGCDTIVD
jgi:hypothetical protein